MLCDSAPVKEIRGSASAEVAAPVERSYELLAGVDRYGEWNGDLVRELEVLDRDPLRIRAVIHVKQSPLMKNFELRLVVHAQPHVVHIERLPNEPTDPEALELAWQVASADGGSRIDLEFAAVVSFAPAFLPLHGVGDLLANRLLSSAVAALSA